MTKKVAVLMMMLYASVALFAQQRLLAGEALARLRETSLRMKNASGMDINFTMKLSVMPGIDMRLRKRGERMALQIGDESTYFYNKIMWICDAADKSVIIQGQRDEMEQTLALMALLPENFGEYGKVIDGKSFVVGQNLFTVRKTKGNIVMSSRKEKMTITITIDSETGEILKMKVRKGMLALSFIYNRIHYSCDENDVTFTVARYSDYKIEDRRKTM